MKKRILSIILSVVACFSLATTGFAVDSCVSEECEEGDRRKFCVIDEPRQYENLRLSQE